MTPGICYVYEYNQSKRIRNVGFLKFAPKYQNIALQLHLRGIAVRPGDSAKLFVFYQQDEVCIAKKILSILCGDKSVSGNTIVPDSDLIPEKSVEDIVGFFLLTENGQYYAAVSAGGAFDTSSIKEWVADFAEAPHENSKQNLGEKPVTEPMEKAFEEPVEDSITPLKETESPEPQQSAPNTVPNETEPETELHATCSAVEDAQTAPADDAHKQEVVQPDTFPKIRKIKRPDLAILPRRCWNIANNSFLMHGYHNFHHLLLVEEEGHFWVGVPGLYSPREAKAAELFGFSQFTKTYVDHLNLEDEEKDSSDEFGHWCRFMR